MTWLCCSLRHLDSLGARAIQMWRLCFRGEGLSAKFTNHGLGKVNLANPALHGIKQMSVSPCKRPPWLSLKLWDEDALKPLAFTPASQQSTYSHGWLVTLLVSQIKTQDLPQPTSPILSCSKIIPATTSCLLCSLNLANRYSRHHWEGWILQFERISILSVSK